MDAIRRADAFIDALAVGRPAPAQDAADAELAALLGNWRDEMRWPPATGLITEADAVAALNAGRAEKRPGSGRDRWTVDTEITPRKNRRGLSVVGAAAAAVLCIGGFGAVVAGAGPGDGLYGLRTMLFGTSKEVRDDQVGLAAKTTLNQVQDLIEQGDWNQAQNKLVEVSTQVASIGDEQQKQDLLDQFNDLSAKVVERDPAATAPPGVVYTVPPSAAELVPAVAPPSTSTSGTPSPSDSTTSAATTSTTPSTSTTPATSTTPSTPTTSTTPATTTTPTTSPTASSTSPTAATSTTTTPAETAASSSTPPASSESTSVAPQSQQATTPTSAAPTTTAGPAGAASTTVAPEPTSVPTTPPVSTSVPAAANEAPTQAASTPAQESSAAAVTTTVLVPVPAG